MYDDQPPFGADERCRAAFFGGHPLARSVLGTVATIEKLPVEAMRDYHRLRYAPGNIVLAASGAVDFAALVAEARRLCDDWEPVNLPDRRAPLAPGTGPSDTQRIVRPEAALEYVVRMSAGPAGSDDARFAAKMLAIIVGDDSGSRLYWELVDPGLAEHASCHHHDFLDAGVFATQLSCDAEDAEALLRRILEIYHDTVENGISPEEWERARNKLGSRVVLAGERPRQRLFTVGLDWAHERTYRSVAEDLRIIESITLEGLHDVMARWPLHGPAATVFAGPGTTASNLC